MSLYNDGNSAIFTLFSTAGEMAFFMHRFTFVCVSVQFSPLPMEQAKQVRYKLQAPKPAMEKFVFLRTYIYCWFNKLQNGCLIISRLIINCRLVITRHIVSCRQVKSPRSG